MTDMKPEGTNMGYVKTNMRPQGTIIWGLKGRVVISASLTAFGREWIFLI